MTASGASGPVKYPALGPYFTVPKGLFQNGLAPRIGPSAVTIYAALCEQANRRNGNLVSVSDRALAADTGVAERTIRQVRMKLCEEGLVTVKREPGASYVYTLIPLKLAAYIPIKQRLRQPKNPRALHASNGTTATLPKRPGVQQKLPHPSGKFCDTSPALFAELPG